MRQFSTNEHSRAFSPFREFHNRTLLYSSNLCSSSSSSEDETANCVFKEVLITNKRKIYIHTKNRIYYALFGDISPYANDSQSDQCLSEL